MEAQGTGHERVLAPAVGVRVDRLRVKLSNRYAN
jgi:hypothetical protein